VAVAIALAASRGKSGGCMRYWGMEIIEDSTACGGGLIELVDVMLGFFLLAMLTL
jgi:hypothetical protein